MSRPVAFAAKADKASAFPEIARMLDSREAPLVLDRRTARSRALHRAVAQKLRADPEHSLAKARARVAHWAVAAPHARYYVSEWTRWLDAPMADLYDLLAADDSEYAESLRRRSPFVGLLDARERWAICHQFRQDRRPDDAP